MHRLCYSLEQRLCVAVVILISCLAAAATTAAASMPNDGVVHSRCNSSTLSPSPSASRVGTRSPSYSSSYSPSRTISRSVSVNFNCTNFGDMITCTYNDSAKCGWDATVSVCNNCNVSATVDGLCPGGCFVPSLPQADLEHASSSWTSSSSSSTAAAPLPLMCATKGKPCRLHNKTTCSLHVYADNACFWLASSGGGSCTACAAFDGSLAPCPTIACYQPPSSLSCIPYARACHLMRDDVSCATLPGCAWWASRDMCTACSLFPNASECGLTAGSCVWVGGGCVAASSLSSSSSSDPVPLVPDTFRGIDGSVVAGLVVGLVVGLVLLFAMIVVIRNWWKKRRGTSRYLSGGLRDSDRAATTQSLSNDIRLSNSGDKKASTLSGLDEAEFARAAKIIKLIRKKKYRQTKLIGRGAHGSVYHCVLDNGTILAVKEVLFTSANHEDLERAMQEMELVSALRHPNVVMYYTSTYDPVDMRYSIFMELVSGGSLGDLVRSSDAPLPEQLARRYARQITSALAFVHEHGIAHRDLKCDNMLLTHDGTIKLSDFGAAKRVGLNNTVGARTMVGTPFFMAPEILGANDVVNASGAIVAPPAAVALPTTLHSQHDSAVAPNDSSGGPAAAVVRVPSKHQATTVGPAATSSADSRSRDTPIPIVAAPSTSKVGNSTSSSASGDRSNEVYSMRCDVWSLGVTVLEMMNRGQAPWPVQSIGATMLHIASPNGIPIFPTHLSAAARDFVEKCVQREPGMRPTAAQLMQHPWLQATNDSDNREAEFWGVQPGAGVDVRDSDDDDDDGEDHAVREGMSGRCPKPTYDPPSSSGDVHSARSSDGTQQPRVQETVPSTALVKSAVLLEGEPGSSTCVVADSDSGKRSNSVHSPALDAASLRYQQADDNLAVA